MHRPHDVVSHPIVLLFYCVGRYLFGIYLYGMSRSMSDRFTNIKTVIEVQQNTYESLCEIIRMYSVGCHNTYYHWISTYLEDPVFENWIGSKGQIMSIVRDNRAMFQRCYIKIVTWCNTLLTPLMATYCLVPRSSVECTAYLATVWHRLAMDAVWRLVTGDQARQHAWAGTCWMYAHWTIGGFPVCVLSDSLLWHRCSSGPWAPLEIEGTEGLSRLWAVSIQRRRLTIIL